MNTRVVRITGRDSLLSAIPVILGFHPADSVVLACLQKGSNRLGPIVRADLAQYRSDPETLAEYLASSASRHADRCLLVFYGTRADPTGFGDLLRKHGMPVLGTAFVNNEPHALLPELHAEYIGLGNVVADNRAALAARVEFDPQTGNQPDLDLMTAMRGSTTRDEFLAAHIAKSSNSLEAVLATCRQVPDHARGAANLCAVAAILAYRTGNGALAWLCLDRTQRIAARHSLAKLIVEVMNAAVPPADLDAVIAPPPRAAD
jgi:hypothetical protein